MTILEYVTTAEFRDAANEATEAIRALGGRGTVEAHFQFVAGRLEGCKWVLAGSKRVVYAATITRDRRSRSEDFVDNRGV